MGGNWCGTLAVPVKYLFLAKNLFFTPKKGGSHKNERCGHRISPSELKLGTDILEGQTDNMAVTNFLESGAIYDFEVIEKVSKIAYFTTFSTHFFT
jgi:hypothetical protein